MFKRPGSRYYNRAFFSTFKDISYNAARTLLPDIYSVYHFNSVVDFGCGSGTWLEAASEIIPSAGKRLVGIDGEHAKDSVFCKEATYIFQNLEDRIAVDGKFDLALSLEVAEHLTGSRAPTFIEDIARASDVCFFCAAVDGQGGINHINEQPQSYWREIWRTHGFSSYDLFRTKYWTSPTFEQCPYYVSNGFLYIRDGHPLERKLGAFRATDAHLIDVVHPAILRSRKEIAFKTHVRDFIPSFIRGLKKRF